MVQEFKVALGENDCWVSLYHNGEEPQKDPFPPKRLKRYTSGNNWRASAVIPDCERLFNEIDATTPWKRQSFVAFGTSYLEPRDTAWFANEGCFYSYRNVDAHSILEWTPPLLELKKFVEDTTGVQVNSALLNKYNNGNDYMQRHADDEPELGDQPSIFSVTLGSSRLFEIIHKKGGERHVISLEAGSLVAMRGNTQQHYYHSILKQKKVDTVRINVTFRTVFPGLYAQKARRPSSAPRIFSKPATEIPKYAHGDIPDIPVFQEFTGRFSIWESGVHRVPMGAICSNLSEGATSILLATHPFNIDEGDRIIFAGSGGAPHNIDCLPTRDQELSHGNLGLLISMIRQKPLRVVKLVGNKRHAGEKFTYLGGDYYITMVYNKIVEIPRRAPCVMWFYVIEKRRLQPAESDSQLQLTPLNQPPPSIQSQQPSDQPPSQLLCHQKSPQSDQSQQQELNRPQTQPLSLSPEQHPDTHIVSLTAVDRPQVQPTVPEYHPAPQLPPSQTQTSVFGPIQEFLGFISKLNPFHSHASQSDSSSLQTSSNFPPNQVETEENNQIQAEALQIFDQSSENGQWQWLSMAPQESDPMRDLDSLERFLCGPADDIPDNSSSQPPSEDGAPSRPSSISGLIERMLAASTMSTMKEAKLSGFFKNKVDSKKLDPFFRNMNKQRNTKLFLLKMAERDLQVYVRRAASSDLFNINRDDNYEFMAVHPVFNSNRELNTAQGHHTWHSNPFEQTQTYPPRLITNPPFLLTGPESDHTDNHNSTTDNLHGAIVPISAQNQTKPKRKYNRKKLGNATNEPHALSYSDLPPYEYKAPKARKVPKVAKAPKAPKVRKTRVPRDPNAPKLPRKPRTPKTPKLHKTPKPKAPKTPKSPTVKATKDPNAPKIRTIPKLPRTKRRPKFHKAKSPRAIKACRNKSENRETEIRKAVKDRVRKPKVPKGPKPSKATKAPADAATKPKLPVAPKASRVANRTHPKKKAPQQAPPRRRSAKNNTTSLQLSKNTKPPTSRKRAPSNSANLPESEVTLSVKEPSRPNRHPKRSTRMTHPSEPQTSRPQREARQPDRFVPSAIRPAPKVLPCIEDTLPVPKPKKMSVPKRGRPTKSPTSDIKQTHPRKPKLLEDGLDLDNVLQSGSKRARSGSRPASNEPTELASSHKLDHPTHAGSKRTLPSHRPSETDADLDLPSQEDGPATPASKQGQSARHSPSTKTATPSSSNKRRKTSHPLAHANKVVEDCLNLDSILPLDEKRGRKQPPRFIPETRPKSTELHPLADVPDTGARKRKQPDRLDPSLANTKKIRTPIQSNSNESITPTNATAQKDGIETIISDAVSCTTPRALASTTALQDISNTTRQAGNRKHIRVSNATGAKYYRVIRSPVDKENFVPTSTQ